MMVTLMSNKECHDHDANKKTKSAYKLKIWMLSERYENSLTSCWSNSEAQSSKQLLQQYEIAQLFIY